MESGHKEMSGKDSRIFGERLECIFVMSHTRLEWIYTLWLPEFQGTSHSKKAWYLKVKWLSSHGLVKSRDKLNISTCTRWIATNLASW